MPETLPINEIKVTGRRREDFGDIDGLAESIRKYGLLHAITVDDESNLIAGERRLRACKSLGWSEIPVRLLRELTDDEKAEIELEENVRRKDLTPYEQSRVLVKLAEVAANVLRSDSLPNASNESSRKRGGQSKPDSETKIADRIGVPQQTINVAKQHVAAVTRYPELAVVAPTQKDAITVAKNLDTLPDEARTEARTQLKKHDQTVLATLAEKPPMPAPKPKPQKSGAHRWRDWLKDTRAALASIRTNGTANLSRQWTEIDCQAFITDLDGFRADLDRLITELEEQRDELKQQVG